jgi:hypothetical protein
VTACWRLAGLAAVLSVAGVYSAWAQDVSPPREAVPAEVVRWFVEGCIVHEGEPVPVMDWALTQGFDPLDPLFPEVGALLAGRAGAVLRSPDGAVMLATTTDGACTVWAERSIGPAVFLALQQAVGQLASRGARVQVQFERNIERAGAWRRQWQARYRLVGGSMDLGLGSVTTLTEAPAAQVLQLSRVPPAGPASDPDGLPRR